MSRNLKKRLLSAIAKLTVLLMVFNFPMVGLTNSYFTDQAAITQNTLSTGYWEAPQLVYPQDGYVATYGSDWANNPYMDWTYSLDGQGAQYVYESSNSVTTNTDGSFQSPVYVSGLLSASQIPAPNTPNGVYYWHVQAYINGQWSPWSSIWQLTVNIVEPTPTPTETPTPTPTPTTPKVVINEVMWMGSTVNFRDEWIELRNTTDRDIDIGQWTIDNTRHSGGITYIMIPASRSIPANGYFLLSNYQDSDPKSALAVNPDEVNSSLELLNNQNGNLILRDKEGNTIDQALGDPNWAKGFSDGTSAGKHQSMERNDNPGDGLNAANWHTCDIYACTSTAYWDNSGNNYGTPKAANLSPDDPTAADYQLAPRPTVILTSTPTPQPTKEPLVATDSATITVTPDDTRASPSAEPTITPAPSPGEASPTPAPSPTPTQNDLTATFPNELTPTPGQSTPTSPDPTPTPTPTPDNPLTQATSQIPPATLTNSSNGITSENLG